MTEMGEERRVSDYATVYVCEDGVLVAQSSPMRLRGDVEIRIDLEDPALGGPLERWPGQPMEAGEIVVSRAGAEALIPLLEGMTAGKGGVPGVMISRVDASLALKSPYLRLFEMRPLRNEVLHVAQVRAARIARGLRAFLTQAQKEAVARTHPQAADQWVIRHVATGTWWRQDRCGYTSEIVCAGLYTEEEARRCVALRSPLNDGTREDEAMPLVEALPRLVKGTVGHALGLGAVGEPGCGPSSRGEAEDDIDAPPLTDVQVHALADLLDE